jgi:carboxymethylenebutenolidase
VTGTTIAINDAKFTGYLAAPGKQNNGQGILLIQEIFGVNSHIRECADLYSELGYTVLAPDVFWRMEPGMQIGYSPEDMNKGIQLMTKLDHQQTLSDLQEAVGKLKEKLPAGAKVASAGYCMGGYFSYMLATESAVDAAVCYYGGGIAQHLDRVSKLSCPIIFHFGRKDAHITMDQVDAIAKAVESKKDAAVYIYDADHGFNCDQRGTYDRHSAMLAFGRSAAFLQKTFLK